NPQQWNPYRTVDAMTVDLTTFNGMSVLAPATAVTDPTSKSGVYHFEAHQRGEKNYLPNNAPLAGQPGEVNLWKQEPALKGTPSPVASWKAAGWTTPA